MYQSKTSKVMSVVKANNRFNFNFKITELPLGAYSEMDGHEKLQKILEKTFIDLKKGKNVEKELFQHIQEYPTVPILLNRLSSYYQLKENYSKSKEINLKTIEQFPDYVFARISLAYDYFMEGDFDAMLTSLGNELAINALFPNKKEFHVDEVVSYYKTVALYLNEEETNGIAFKLIEDMIERFPNHYETLYQTEQKMMSINMDRFIEGKKQSTKVNGEFIQTIPASTTKPTFENDIINELYRFDFSLPQHTLREIVNLPKDSLERDLIKVLNSGISLYNHLTEEDVSYEETNFIIHALFIAAENKLKGIYPELLAILKGGDEFTSFYFIEELIRIQWLVFYKLYEDNIDQLFTLLKERNIDTITKMIIDDAIEQLFYHHPEHQQSIILAYKDLAQYFINHQDEPTLKDTEFIASLACTMRDISLNDLDATIKELYDNNLVAIFHAGKYKNLIQSERTIEDRLRSIPDIYQMYQDELIVPENPFLKPNFNLFNELKDDFNYSEPFEVLPVRTEPKIGRNDSCPCGSGKKYKKCCLKD